jgi:hypothetical protein
MLAAMRRASSLVNSFAADSARDGLLQILSKAYASRIYRESIRVYVQNI